ncbi:GCN5 family acetyltransferase [Paenibacillus yonginensis]|uniref:GCN5 family acetyltransferase n=1 Tax=Paenibacillus yonginensis TaxID=1462996 RepID=A0A1B1N0U4_9BACL|nr:GNAT family N-acetyltransferase [Paenibacillus yonginensis]ANS75042.1 GCN5 family acetyltransferase [Paenibacillus yonginensis]
MAAVIIPVKSEDQLQNCLDIRQEVFVEEQKVPVSLEIDEFDHIAGDAHHLLIEQDGQYAATGRITYYKDNAAKIQRVAVRKAFRSKGIGKVLMIGLEELARELGFEKAVLDGQLHAVPFYEKLGYAIISKEPFDDAGILHHRMEKKL